ncbi:MAG: hypothetical protein CHACPFDD_02666 [Phycisphaerae bacterium]|nr:hypothetical protein [Phycisphaerae bacterium]
MPRRALLALLIPLLLTTACRPAGSDDAGSGGDAQPRPKTAAELLASAPADWPAFLDWAATQLAARPQPVPAPRQPRLATPRWALIRLEDLLAGADVRCDYQPPPPDALSSLALGPFRSDQQSENLRVQPVTDEYGDGLLLTLSDFEVQRERIGAVEINLLVPFGRHFDLIWSPGGRIRVPVPEHTRYWNLRLATDGFADWSGPLRELRLRLDGLSRESVQIRALRFLPRALSFPEPVALQRVSLSRETRSAIYAHTPAEVRFTNLSLPARARLALGVGLVGSSPADTAPAASTSPAAAVAPRATVDIDIESFAGRTTLIAHTIDQPDRWLDLSADLAAFAGQTVTLTLRARADQPAIVCWGNPVIYQPVENPPRVLIYLIDALAARHVGLYGCPRPTTPRIDALAAEGVWFANAFSNAPRTVESVPNLMLSMHSERHGVHHASSQPPRALVTLAEALRAAGFATASFVTNVNAGPQQGMDAGFDTFHDRIDFKWGTGESDRTVPIDEAVQWLRAHADRPAFAYIHTAEPHSPYTPPAGFAGRFDADFTGTIDGTLDPQRGFIAARNERDRQHVVALYQEEVLYADTRLGLFLDALAGEQLDANLTLFVTADHGEEFLEHGVWEHAKNLHAEQLRIPLVARGPRLARGRRVDQPAQLVDLMPTLLDMFAIPPPYDLAGDSLLPLLADAPGDTANAQPLNSSRNNVDAAPRDAAAAPPDAAAWRRRATALSERAIVASNFNYSAAGCIENALVEAGRWKLMYRYRDLTELPGGKTTRFALFDLAADPQERVNLLAVNPNASSPRAADVNDAAARDAADARARVAAGASASVAAGANATADRDAIQKTARRLIGDLLAWAERQPPFEAGAEGAQLMLDAAQLRELQALGYVQGGP